MKIIICELNLYSSILFEDRLRLHRADFAEDGYIQELISYKFPSEYPCSDSPTSSVEFTEEENMAMLQLPRKECQELSSSYLFQLLLN